jgi:hypothetical protein
LHAAIGSPDTLPIREILQREELAMTEQSGDQDKVTPAVDDESEPADDPWQGFPLDDVVYRSE